MMFKRLFLMIGMACFTHAAMAQQTFPARWPRVSVADVQFVADSLLQQGITDPSDYDYQTDTFVVDGYVVFDPRYYGLSGSGSRASAWLMDTTIYVPFGGVEFMCESGNFDGPENVDEAESSTQFFASMRPGRKIRAAAFIDVFEGEQQVEILLRPVEIVSLQADSVEPVVADIGDFMKNDGSGSMVKQTESGEPYEGSLVEFQDVTVVNVGGGSDRYQWAVQDAQGNRISIRDMSSFFRNDGNSYAERNEGALQNYTFTPPSQGTLLNYIRGMIYTYQDGDEYWLAPRDTNDLEVGSATPVIQDTRRPVVPSSNDTVDIIGIIEDQDGQIDNAQLHYRTGFDDAQSFTTVEMSPVGPANDWAAEIPAQPNGTYVQYWIGATDNENNSTAYPDSSANGSFYQVTDGGITSIAQLQQSIPGGTASQWAGDTLDRVNLTALVSASSDQFFSNLGAGEGNYAALQQDTNAFGGIFVRTAEGGSDIGDWIIGEEVQITGGVVEEVFGVTYLTYADSVNNNVLGAPSNRVLQPAILNVDSAIASNEGDGAYLEQYEGMFVRFENVFVSDLNADDVVDSSSARFFGEWAFSDSVDTGIVDSITTVGFRVDDASGFVPENLPLDTLSLGDTLQYVQGLMYRSFGNWKLIPRDLNDIAPLANPNSVRELSHSAGLASVRVYPNPARNYVTIEVEANKAVQAPVQILDLSGRSLMERQMSVQPGLNSLRIGLDQLEEGVYLYRIGQRGFGKLQVR